MPPIISNALQRLMSSRPLGPVRPDPRFLFLQYERPLGTAALATATLAALRVRRPDAHVTVAAAGPPAALLRDSPLIDELLVTPHAVDAFPAALSYFLINVRRRRFDYVITDSGNARTKIATLAIASGAAARIGFTRHPWLFHAALAGDPARSNLANNLRVLDAIGLPGPPAEPHVHFSASALRAARELLGAGGQRPRIAMVTQTSQGHPNAWFDDRWAELSNSLSTQFGARLVFVGAPSDAGGIDRIRARISSPTWSAAGRTPLPVLAALLAECDLVVTIDTGAMHMARAARTPAVVLANAAQPAEWWLPNGDPHFHVLRKDYVPCALCLRFSCATRECMQEITVEEVVHAVRAQLDLFRPSRAARERRVKAGLTSESAEEPVARRVPA